MAVIALVTTVGRNKLLDACFKTGEAASQWFVGLIDAASFTAYAAADTMASHGGWLESSIYSNATRPAYVGSVPIGGLMSNTGTRAAFTINAPGTVIGAFLVDDNTVNGVAGTLYGEGSLSALRPVVTGDTLNITVILTD